MSANTGRFLDSTHINEVARAYSLAYLRKKKVRINNDESEIDGRWNLGNFEEGYLLRTEDNSLFTLYNFPEIADANIAKQKQVVGSNLHENFINIIAHLIATKKAHLPSNNIKVALCINHHNFHWTQLLAEFSQLNHREYKALYKAYQEHANSTNENQYEDGSQKPLNIIRNNVVNFLKRQNNIYFNGDRNQANLRLGNNQLPLKVGSIALRHFDSLGKNTSFARDVADSVKHFAIKNKARFFLTNCEHQTGSTCADWSVYNAFRHGVIKSAKRQPASSDLREFFENRNVDNAHQILFAKKPQIQEIAKRERITINQEQRNLDRMLPLLAQGGAVMSFSSIPLVGTLFERISKLFFGKRALVLEKKHGKPIVKSVEQHTGIGEFLGYKPFQDSLATLESEINKLIRQDGSITDNQQVEVLTHRYAKKIVEENPDCFSEQDKAVVRLDSYALR